MIPGSANPLLLATAAGGAGGYQIERSLRFNSSDSAYLSKSLASSPSSSFTFSLWVKRSALTPGSTYQFLIGAYQAGGAIGIGFGDDDVLRWTDQTTTLVSSTAKFRDPSAWYHMVFTRTPSARTMYVNGVQVATGDAGQAWSNGATWNIGQAVGLYHFSGYLADVHFIDGEALDPTSFGEFDNNGIWQPIDASGLTYGTNGFHLDFADNSTVAALGTDTSGNGNDWDVYNIQASSSGQVYSSMLSGSVKTATAGFTAPFNVGRSEGTGGLTFTPATPIPYSSSVEIYDNNNVTKAQVNGGAFVQMVTNSWVTVASGSGTITSIYSVRTDSPSYDAGWQAIRVDGSILYDANLAGVDSLVDSPTNYGTDTGAGGEVRGNYATLNAVAKGFDCTLSNGNLDYTYGISGTRTGTPATIGMSTGKWYWEIVCTSKSGASLGVINGISNTQENSSVTSGIGAYPGYTAQGWGYFAFNGDIRNNSSNIITVSSYTINDVIGFAFDADAGKFWVSKNGVWQNSGDPAAGTGAVVSSLPSATYYPCVGDGDGGDSHSANINFGQRPFAYTAPSGFKALCTTNLEPPTIADGSQYFQVIKYTGNGTTQTLPNINSEPSSGLNFSPDLVWLRNRTQASNWVQFDTVRGALIRLVSNLTVAEASLANSLTSFDSTGFTYGSEGSGNNNGDAFAAFCWDAGSSTVTNTQGSITSQVRANASAGFSIVTYTTDTASTNQTIGHGLGVQPKLIIIKARNQAYNWDIYHGAISNAKDGRLIFTTAAFTTAAAPFGGVDPTSSVFTMRQVDYGNNVDCVAYCFAPVAGYSSGFSYTGNGSADGSFVYLGFRPRLILLKCSSTTGNWTLVDTAREGYNVDNDPLYPNLSNAEGTTDLLDITSNGFKLRTTDASVNSSGATYVGYAWAETPFAYSRAR